jgi:LSD1 subclass zinc finger protein
MAAAGSRVSTKTGTTTAEMLCPAPGCGKWLMYALGAKRVRCVCGVVSDPLTADSSVATAEEAVLIEQLAQLEKRAVEDSAMLTTLEKQKVGLGFHMERQGISDAGGGAFS